MQHVGIKDKQVDSENISLDPSVLKEKGERYSSLTDTNGVNLFTDEYEDAIKDVQMKEEDFSYNIQNKIFYLDLDSSKGESDYQQVQGQLFLNMDRSMKKEIVKGEKNQLGMMVASVGIMLIIFFFALLSLSEKREKRRRADAVNTYTYE